PRHRVAGPEATLEALAHGNEQRIPDRVTQALVDHLEAVEVEEDQRDRVLVAVAATRQRMRYAVSQEVAVRQAGDRVVQRAALRGLEEVGVVEGDRRELGEPAQGADL